MKRYIRAGRTKDTSYPHYYKDYVIYRSKDDGMYYVCDAIYDEVLYGPFQYMSEAEEYLDEFLY